METEKQTISTKQFFKIGDLELDIFNRRAIRDYRIINLSPKEYLLLRFLFLSKNKILTKSQIWEEVWGKKSKSSTAIRVCICSLREKIDRNHAKKLIHSYYNVGYILQEI